MHVGSGYGWFEKPKLHVTCVGTFAGLYRETLERIEANGYDVFDGKPQISVPAKLRIVAGSFL